MYPHEHHDEQHGTHDDVGGGEEQSHVHRLEHGVLADNLHLFTEIRHIKCSISHSIENIFE